MSQAIPNFPFRFFKWFCHPDYVEDLEGDLRERFDNHLKLGHNARLLFWLDVLRLFRPGLIRPLYPHRWTNGISLLRHHLLLSRRSLIKDRTYSVINVLGLGLSIASAAFVYSYVEQEQGFDQFHTDYHSKFRITTSYARADEPRRSLATTPPSLTPILIQDLPEVEQVVRLFKYPWDLTIASDRVKFRETEVLFVEPDFLNLFSFELIQGDMNTCLTQVRTMVVTESTAVKYFGAEDPIGKLVNLDGASEAYEITGLIKDPPSQSHIQFDFLISYETIDWWWEGEAKESWDPHEFYTYVELNSSAYSSVFIGKLNTIVQHARGEQNESTGLIQQFDIQPISSIHLNSALENELSSNLQGNATMVSFLSGVSWFILIIGWINYINLSTAKVARRTLEVGIKKVLGASQMHLVTQFVTEAFMVNFMAAFLGLALFVIGIDYFNVFAGASLSLNLFSNPDLWFQLLSVWLLGTLFSGLYPALLLASHPVVGKSTKRSALSFGLPLRRILVTFQFTTSIVLIAGTFIIYQQLEHMGKAYLGFDLDNVMIIKAANHTDEESDSLIVEKYNAFINGLRSQSMIKYVSSGATTPGEQIYDAIPVRTAIVSPQESQSFNYTWVGYDYFKSFGIKILAGRTFDPSFIDEQSLLINQSAALQLGFSSVDAAIGQQVVIGRSGKRTVIGVFEDYRQESFHRAISPMVVDLGSAPVIYYSASYSGDPKDVLVTAEELFGSIYPRDPFDYYFLDTYYNRQYEDEHRMSHVSSLFSTIAIIIACLGLFGLASFGIIQRTKEIGIRKVLGARVLALIYLLFKEYALLIAVASTIAIPLVYITMNDWLEGFTASVGIGLPLLLSTCLLVLLLAFLAVSSIVMDIAKSNPVNALRNE